MPVLLLLLLLAFILLLGKGDIMQVSGILDLLNIGDSGTVPGSTDASSGINWGNLTDLLKTGANIYGEIEKAKAQANIEKAKAQGQLYATINPNNPLSFPINNQGYPAIPYSSNGVPISSAVPYNIRTDNTFLYIGLGVAVISAAYFLLRK